MADELEAQAKARADLMKKVREISENLYTTSWKPGIEFDLWENLHDKRYKVGGERVAQTDRVTLVMLAQEAGGWVIAENEEEPHFIEGDDWLKKFESWKYTGSTEFDLL